MYPDAYEVGLPNQGVQILYEVLNERADALAERTYAVWPDLEALHARARHRPVHRRRPPSGRRVRPARRLASPPSSATRTCSPRSTWPASRCTPPTATRRTRSSSPAATPRSTPSRSPTSSTPPCSATASRPSARSPTSSRDWKAAGRPGGRDELLLRLAATGGVYVPRFYDVDLPARRPHRRGHARTAPACPSGSASTPSWTSTSGRTRRRRSCRWPRRCTSGCRVEIFRGCTRGCRFCQAGMITRPVRERSIDGIGEMVDAGPGRHRLRGGRPAVAVQSPTTPRSAAMAKQLADRYDDDKVGLSLPSTRVDAFNIDLANEFSPQRPPLRADLRARGRLGAAAPRDQQDGQQGRPDPHRQRPPTRRAGGR